jgi:hypothetical protein
MTSAYPCNHDTHVEIQDGQIIDRCGICGEAVWTRPARQPIDWLSASPLVALLATAVGLLAWLAWSWIHATGKAAP